MADVPPTTRSITSATDVPTGNLVVRGDKSVEKGDDKRDTAEEPVGGGGEPVTRVADPARDKP